MPFFFSGMWIFPMFVMPLICFAIMFFLYKKGAFNSILAEFGDQEDTINREPSNELEVKSNEALEIAKLRYAKGEITKEEYQQIKLDLRN